MIQDTIVASREYNTPSADFRSFVGVAYMKDGRMITSLLDPHNMRMALPISHYKCEDYKVTVFHTFVGLYLDRIAKTHAMQCEVFRFHRDIFKFNCEDYQPNGDVLAYEEREHAIISLSIERFPHQPELADTDFLVKCVLADRMEDTFAPCPVQLAPEAAVYTAGAAVLPHPGLAFEDMELEVEMATMNRKSTAKVKYLN